MIGENLNGLRGMHGLTLSTLSKDVRLSPQCLSLICNDRRTPSLHTARKLSKFFGVTLDELLGDTETCLSAGLKSYRTCPARSAKRGRKDYGRTKGYSKEECAIMRTAILRFR